MLLVLAAGAAFIAVASLAAWWVVVPPAIMLAGYLGLLREAAKADAERTRAGHEAAVRARGARDDARMAAYEREAAKRPEARGQPAISWQATTEPPAAAPPQPTAPPLPTAPPQPAATAEVLDITARMAEEPYDQYADAELRAVGD